MKIGVVGSGGREHAIVKKLVEDARVSELYAFPGNGGIAMDATCVNIAATDCEGVVAFSVQHELDFVVVTPDDPLALGMVDALEEAGIPAFGPTKAAAQIESSKAYAKRLMQKYHIPTADFAVFSDAEKACEYVATCNYPVVVKASGLALGKGVLICNTREEATSAVVDMLEGGAFGESGSTIVIEEFLEGPEVSVLAFCDGEVVRPLVSSQDHKRALDGDCGLNTGGMGTVAPNPYYTKTLADTCMMTIFEPTVRAMAEEGAPFKGCLFFGLILTADGPKVLEYNCRFGDPETQVVLPLLTTPLLDCMLACREGTLATCPVALSDEAACCVVITSKGYPKAYETGFEIELVAPGEKEELYVAGAQKEGDKLVSSGGRVLNAVAVAPTLAEAQQKAYALAASVTFSNGYMRTDIGKRALEALAKQ